MWSRSTFTSGVTTLEIHNVDKDGEYRNDPLVPNKQVLVILGNIQVEFNYTRSPKVMYGDYLPQLAAFAELFDLLIYSAFNIEITLGRWHTRFDGKGLTIALPWERTQDVEFHCKLYNLLVIATKDEPFIRDLIQFDADEVKPGRITFFWRQTQFATRVQAEMRDFGHCIIASSLLEN